MKQPRLHPGTNADIPASVVEFQQAIDAMLDHPEDEIVPLASVPGIAGKREVKRLILKRFPFSVIIREHHHRNLPRPGRARINPSENMIL